MEIEEAAKKCNNAAIAGCVSGVISFLLVAYAIYSNASDNDLVSYFNDPIIFFDILIIFVLAGGVFLKSRTAAVLLLLFFVVSKIIMFSETGKITGIGLALVFAYFFYQGIIGSFAYTRLRREENPKYRKKPIWLIIVALAGVTLLTGLLGVGLFMTITDAPSTAVESGDDLPDSYSIWLIENGVIEVDEQIELFYSEGAFSIEGGGNILTNRRVISYFKSEEGEIEIHYANFKEIISLKIQHKGDFLSDTLLEVVYGADGDQGWFLLLLSAESGGDQKFIDMLEKKTGLRAELLEAEAG